VTGEPAHLVELIRSAAVQLQAAALAGDAATHGLLTAEFAGVLAEWLFEAAGREQKYRVENENWTRPAVCDEAHTAGLIAAQLLGLAPARYELTKPED
jgi:hypothetical protein